MKNLERVRKDLEKAIERRDQTRKRLEADEYIVKQCQATLAETENNVIIGEFRAWGLSVEDVIALRKASKNRPIAEILAAMRKEEQNEEFMEETDE